MALRPMLVLVGVPKIQEIHGYSRIMLLPRGRGHTHQTDDTYGSNCEDYCNPQRYALGEQRSEPIEVSPAPKRICVPRKRWFGSRFDRPESW